MPTSTVAKRTRAYARRTSDTCSVDGCDKPFLAKEMCSKHYNRVRDHGDVNRGRQPPPRPRGVENFTEKTCNRCEKTKPIASFKSSGERGYTMNTCRTCLAPDRMAWKLKHKYGLSLEEYEQMVEEQNGLCAICAQPPPEGRRLYVDHDHDTNEVRRLLCPNCNSALGLLGDSPGRLEAAAAYLRRHGR